MTDPSENFDWAWAEQEESEQALRAALASFYEDDPLSELLWLCFSSAPELEGITERFELDEAAELRSPPDFPKLPDRCDLLQACCQNPTLESAEGWLRFCLDSISFAPERVSAALLQGCWAGWFLGDRSRLAEMLLGAGADVEKIAFTGDTPLLSIFRAWDEPSEAHFFGSLSTLCEALLEAGAQAQRRNKAGESPLSRLNLRMSETLLGMADDVASADLLRCAQLLLDHGADSASVREAPPLEMVVPHPGLRGMLQGAAERAVIGDFLTSQGPERPAPPAPSRARGSSRL